MITIKSAAGQAGSRRHHCRSHYVSGVLVSTYMLMFNAFATLHCATNDFVVAVNYMITSIYSLALELI